MAPNYKFSGKRISIVGISADVSAGALTRSSGFIGVPLNHALSGLSCSFALEGVWGLTFDVYSGGQPGIGSILYWDTSTGLLSIGADNDDFPILKCVTAVSASDGSFEGLLLPQTRPYGQTQA